MKIAIVGSRGIPARYGGFETFAEEISLRLVEKGHEITVSCEYLPHKSRINEYKGVKLDYFPLKPPNNYFLRKIYENMSDIYFLTKLSKENDFIYFLGAEVAEFFFIPKIVNSSTKLVVNTDGAMWKRDKFNRVEKWLLELFYTNLAPVFADIIIVDAEEMKNFVKDKYDTKTFFIPYGVDIPPKSPFKREYLNKLKKSTELKDISKNKYWLMIARLEPENNIHIILDAFKKAKTNFPLLVIGDFTSDKYKTEINNLILESTNKILLLGSVYEKDIINMLRENCFAYFHGHSTGGTNPSLLEIMASKTLILAHNNKFNKEVCCNSAVYFENVDDLANKIESVEKEHNKYIEFKNNAYNRIKSVYQWEKIADDYDKIFQYHNAPTDIEIRFREVLED